jgi:hypothetical protein
VLDRQGSGIPNSRYFESLFAVRTPEPCWPWSVTSIYDWPKATSDAIGWPPPMKKEEGRRNGA